MFDILDKVRECWEKSMFIFLLNFEENVEKVTAILPSQQIHFTHFQQLREFHTTDPYVTLTYEFCKILEIPYMNTIYRAVSSRYPIVDSMLPFQDGTSISESSYSLALDHIATQTGSTYKDMELTIQSIGDLVDQTHSNVKTSDVKKEFSESFRVPGHVRLVRSSLGGLRKKISTVELSLALCEVAKVSPSTIIADLIDIRTGDFLSHKDGTKIAVNHGNIATIDSKTVIDLWRSIFKVPKSELTSLQ